MRRSVLQEKARLSNDKTTSLTNGNMLHQLFQICLRTMDFSTAFIQHNIDTIISRHILDLFEIGVSEAIAKQTLSDSIRNIQKWAAEFIQTKESKRASPHSKKEKVQIKEVLDIEETIWSPKFGIKGNIDASITIMRESSDDLETMPLELKTGLSTMANSHKAQTIIYTQLMKDRYATNTTAGLLVYLKSGETQIVPASRNELRGILMQRNALARYLRSENGTLPPLQENKYSCQKCFALNSCMMYHKFYEEGTEDLKELLPSFREKTGHLTDRHRSFFVKWEKVLEIESRYMQQTRRELWTLCGEEREKLGRCLSAMMVADCIEHPTWESKGSRYTYSFQRPQQPSGSKATASLLNSNINVGEPIVISSEEDDSYALASGFVLEIAPGTIKVIVDRKINKDHHDDTKRYRIDKDDLTGGLSRLRGNLINLLVSEQDEHKRSLIIDLERPIFESYNSANALVRTDSTFNLNDDQIRAINKVACAKDYALILGMPGTGKTTTIAALVQHLLKLGKSILLTAYTHSAIDNVLLKLKASGVRFLRFGNKSKIHPDIRDVAFDPFKFKSVADLKHSLAEQKLIATTCLGVDG
ncbi:DNA replication factor Dna2-domain-containing protein [Chytridium lagenaria]|nr:DNA replication factor Dna2-domain-containing protein [Chytridium lagenaria]